MADLSEQIEEAANGPARAAADGVDVTARPIRDLIEADKYLTAKRAAATNKTGGLRFAKLVPPGTTGREVE